MIATPLPTDLISTGTAGKLAGCHKLTVWRWVKSGRLRGWQTAGGHYRVSRAEVLGLVRQIRTPKEPAPRLPTPRQQKQREEWEKEVLACHGLVVPGKGVES